MAKSSKGGVTLILAGAFFIGVVVLTMVFLQTHESEKGSGVALAAANPAEVCMVQNRVLGKPQIPVEYDGKTYYGCCSNCVARVKNDRRVRYSVDPVSGREVDKAAAVIIEGPGGMALYFESESTARKYLAGVAGKG